MSIDFERMIKIEAEINKIKEKKMTLDLKLFKLENELRILEKAFKETKRQEQYEISKSKESRLREKERKQKEIAIHNKLARREITKEEYDELMKELNNE